MTDQKKQVRMRRVTRALWLLEIMAKVDHLYEHKGGFLVGEIASIAGLSNSSHLRGLLNFLNDKGYVEIETMDYLPNQTWYRLYRVTGSGREMVVFLQGMRGRQERLPGFD